MPNVSVLRRLIVLRAVPIQMLRLPLTKVHGHTDTASRVYACLAARRASCRVHYGLLSRTTSALRPHADAIYKPIACIRKGACSVHSTHTHGAARYRARAYLMRLS